MLSGKNLVILSILFNMPVSRKLMELAQQKPCVLPLKSRQLLISKSIEKNQQTTFFILAGEQSADNHGAVLMQAIQAINPNMTFLGIGGEKMLKVGLKPIENIFWPENGAPRGKYGVRVHCYRYRGQGGQPVSFRVRMKINGKLLPIWSGRVNPNGTVYVYNFTR